MQTLRDRAQDAQDAMGWAPMPATTDGESADAFTRGAIDLGRVVVQLARRVEQLEQRLDAMAERMDRGQ